jgi:hypothetical protein
MLDDSVIQEMWCFCSEIKYLIYSVVKVSVISVMFPYASPLLKM